MKRINGFSNSYWGWGLEDDDISIRILAKGYNIIKYPETISRYTTITHVRDRGNPVNNCMQKILQRTKRIPSWDGLSNLKYKLIASRKEHLFSHVLIDPLPHLHVWKIKKICGRLATL
uniref:Galactosyltransferase C-terminal domain-containing protein n=1 Tax=Panagrolaimus sp. JU765 TaxID=591449 RepID=A0AC34PXW8_9BILA